MPPVGPASAEPPPYEARSVRLGEWKVTALTDGSMRLDGGSMWGVVPAALWRRMTPPAPDNTIPIALRPFLAERGREKVLIEVGIGGRWDERWRSIYSIDREVPLVEALARAGVEPAEITHVVASHCHFDHVGAQVVERGGSLVPLFPNAVHHAPRIEVEVAEHPDHVRSASYRAEDVVPIRRADLLRTWEGDAELLPGIRVHEATGHSDGLSVVTVNEDGGDEVGVFWTDVVPTTHHVQPAYIMAFDIDVPRSFASRSRWLAHAAERGWTGLFYHDVDHAFARVVPRAGGRYGVEPCASSPSAPA